MHLERNLEVEKKSVACIVPHSVCNIGKKSMFISEAFAQAAGAPGGDNAFMQFLPFILIIGVFYFLMIRPQQKRIKEHKAMVGALRRGDNVVTSGGIVAKVSRVIDDHEIELEIASGVKVKVIKSTISTVMGKPAPANDTAEKK